MIEPESSSVFKVTTQTTYTIKFLDTSCLRERAFRIQKRLGKGSFGVVSLVQEEKSQEPFAIKEFAHHISAADVFQMEITRIDTQRRWRNLLNLSHHNVIKYCAFELYPPEGLAEIKGIAVMEYCSLGSLTAYMRKTFLLWSEIRNITDQLVQGLTYLHGNEIIHADLRASNVVLEEQPADREQIIVKIADLDNHQDIQSISTWKAIRSDHAVHATLSTMSPEMKKTLAGNGTFDKRTDIWSLGCIVFDLVKESTASFFAAEPSTSNVAGSRLEGPEQTAAGFVEGGFPEITLIVPRSIAEFLKACSESDFSQRLSALELQSCDWLGLGAPASPGSAPRIMRPREQVLNPIVRTKTKAGDVVEYQLDQFLGVGTRSTVFSAKGRTRMDVLTGVAVKKMQMYSYDACIARIKMELKWQILLELRHPNIAVYYSAQVLPFSGILPVIEGIIAMRCEERDLTKYFDGIKRLTEEASRGITTQILSDLEYLHKNGIVHGNLKPSKILVSQERDFGPWPHARITGIEGNLHAADLANEHIKTTTAIFTRYYLPPQVFYGVEMYAGGEVDIWGLGCIVVEMLRSTCRDFSPPGEEQSVDESEYVQMSSDESNCVPRKRYMWTPTERNNSQRLFPALPDGISHQAGEFLATCFEFNAEMRPSARELQQHEWISDCRLYLDGQQDC